MSYIKYPLLEEAYDQYQRTLNNEFVVIPKNPEYLISVLNAIPTLLECGYITDVTPNLLHDASIDIVPLEHMSFSITGDGIKYVRCGREC